VPAVAASLCHGMTGWPGQPRVLRPAASPPLRASSIPHRCHIVMPGGRCTPGAPLVGGRGHRGARFPQRGDAHGRDGAARRGMGPRATQGPACARPGGVERDHGARRYAPGQRRPHGADPRGQAPRMLRLWISSPCRLPDGPCAVAVASDTASRPSGSRPPWSPHDTCTRCACRDAPWSWRVRASACGTRWHWRWPRAWDEAICVNTGWRARHVRALWRIRLDGPNVTQQ
jgi:hypothetical protein